MIVSSSEFMVEFEHVELDPPTLFAPFKSLNTSRPLSIELADMGIRFDVLA